MLQKIKSFIRAHKVISSLAIIVILVVAFNLFKSKASTETRYVTEAVAKGNIITTVTGTGQIGASNTIDINSKVSGTITYVGVNAGDTVNRGKVIARIDSTDAQKTVRDAELNLLNAKLALEKLKIQNSADNLDTDLQKIYNDGFGTVSNVHLDLSPTMNGLESIINQQNLSYNNIRSSGNIATDYRVKAEDSFYKAQTSFNQNTKDFSLINRNSPQADIKNIINETYTTVDLLSQAVKNTKDLVGFMSTDTGKTADYTTTENTLSGYTTTLSNDLASLFTAKTNITNYNDTSLNNNLDIQSSLLSVQQKQNSLLDAKNALLNYDIVAPFDGVISSVPVKVGDSATGAIATIITKQKIATVSLNEVDIAKINLGQKVTLTFDAIDSLTITGKVVEIDSIGTVSSGVVTYSVKISLDLDDNRVKPGMSVSAVIITDTVQDVIVVPNGAVKTKNGTSYVEVFDAALPQAATGVQGSVSLSMPRQVEITAGLVSDTSTEIISGLKVGDIIVTKTISSTAAKTTTTPSILSAVGGNRVRGN